MIILKNFTPYIFAELLIKKGGGGGREVGREN